MYPLMKDDKKGDKKEKTINEDVVEKKSEEYIGRLVEKKKQGSKRKKYKVSLKGLKCMTSTKFLCHALIIKVIYLVMELKV